MATFSRKIFLWFFIFLQHPVLHLAQETPNFKLCVVENGNYTSNSNYQKNLNHLLESIYTNTEIQYGFYNFSFGLDTDSVYAIALCRGDISSDKCRSCIQGASRNLTSACPEQKEAIIGFDDCMLRYANRYIFGIMENAPYFFANSMNNVSDPTGFIKSLKVLFDELREQAASGNDKLKCAIGERTSNFPPMYAMLQCTPDLSKTQCDECLYNATERIHECCEARQGGRVIYPSCNFRYEISSFYGPLVVDGATSPSPSHITMPVSPKPKKKKWIQIVIKIVVPIVAFVVLVICIVGIIISRRRRRNQIVLGVSKILEVDEDDGDMEESLQFTFGTIKAATNNFSDSHTLGRGGFGTVYKGVLSEGREIAVKRLSRDSKQGQVEFMNEVKLLAKLRHRNLVSLLGFCLEGKERLLVYEFLPNSSLEKYISADDRNMEWEVRYKIISGIARGLLYLHEDSPLRIIHRDLKPSNILLDAKLNPKISDFGMARFFKQDESHEKASRIAGTFGYIAPEYMSSRHVSTKSDVFSFGVLVLEIAIGKKNSDLGSEDEVMNIQTYAWENWNQGKCSNLIDSAFGENWENEITRCIHIGLLCVQENAGDRPIMSMVVGALTSQAIPLEEPSRPGYFMHSTEPQATTSPHSVAEGNSGASVNEASITEVYGR